MAEIWRGAFFLKSIRMIRSCFVHPVERGKQQVVSSILTASFFFRPRWEKSDEASFLSSTGRGANGWEGS